MDKIKVLIVDDSAIVRQVLTMILSEDAEIEVIGVAADPYFAMSKMQKDIPDVITLDIEMPRMDGLTFLKKLMSEHPIPVVIISSLTQNGVQLGLRAIELGAVEIINKPNLSSTESIEEAKIKIVDIVKAAARAKLKNTVTKSPQIQTISKPTITVPPKIITKPSDKSSISDTTKQLYVAPKLTADVILPYIKTQTVKKTDTVIVVGASTGGTEALREFLIKQPANCPGIAIVQHMPENFTRSFAERLDQICTISVKEASDGDQIMRGRALIAPGSHHILLKRAGDKYFIEINSGPLVNRHRPSVDILFRSAAMCAGKNALGIIMTGMGDDGARGMFELKDSRAITVAQDEKSCIVFGMPKEAIRLGGVDYILPLNQIADFVANIIG